MSQWRVVLMSELDACIVERILDYPDEFSTIGDAFMPWPDLFPGPTIAVETLCIVGDSEIWVPVCCGRKEQSCP